MLQRAYIIIFIYFLIGAIAIYFINRKTADATANKERWLKYGTYLLIVNGIVAATQYATVFGHLATVILLLALWEVVSVWRGQTARNASYLIGALAVMCCAGLIFRAYANIELAEKRLYVYVVVFVFDGFCQICGQLFGRHKLSPRISPNKTTEGLAGGFVITIATSLLFAAQLDYGYVQCAVITGVLCIASLIGDLAASYYKRLCGVKDYSRLIPGHGGVLDRFDSFIFAGAVYYAIYLIPSC